MASGRPSLFWENPNAMPRYYGSGKLRRWLPAIKRWRRGGISWRRIGALLFEFDVWTAARWDGDRKRAEYCLGMLAFQTHKQFTRRPTLAEQLDAAEFKSLMRRL